MNRRKRAGEEQPGSMELRWIGCSPIHPTIPPKTPESVEAVISSEKSLSSCSTIVYNATKTVYYFFCFLQDITDKKALASHGLLDIVGLSCLLEAIDGLP